MDTPAAAPAPLPQGLLGPRGELLWADDLLRGLVACSASGPSAPQWDSLLSQVERAAAQVLESGVGCVDADPIRLFGCDDAGRPMETYWLAALSPDANGGVRLALVEVTRRVIVERRWETVRALSALDIAQQPDLTHAGRAVLSTLQSNRITLPWGLCYVDSGHGLELVDAYAVRHPGRLALASLGAAPGPESAHPLERARAQRSDRLVLSGPLLREVAPSPLGPTPPARAALLRLCSDRTGEEVGLLVLGLNPYRPDEGLFREFLTLVRQQAEMVLEAAAADARAAHLEVALASNRTVATAIGIVMAREHLTAQAAFARLRQVSNELNRRVVDLADQVVLTGALPTSPPG